MKNENLENLEEKEYFGIVSVRILVHEWPMTSGSSLQLIVIQEEVVEMDGKQVRWYILINWELNYKYLCSVSGMCSVILLFISDLIRKNVH